MTTREDAALSFRDRLQASDRYPTAVLLAALSGVFATTFPVTVLTVAIPEMANDFHTSESTLAWVVTLPLLLSAVATPVLGKMGDLYGHRRVFLLGFAVATVTTAITATAWNPTSLIFWRTVTQVIGAATGPTSIALINSQYTSETRAKAMGWWAMTAAAAPAIGLVIGGPLVQALGWQMLFLLQAGFMAAAVIGATVVLAETPRPHAPRFDIPGAGLLMVATGALMLLLKEGTVWGWTSPAVVAAAVLAPAGLLLFIRTEQRALAPMLPLEFFRRPNFSAAIVTTLLSGGAYMGGFFIAPLVLRQLFGYSITAAVPILLIRPVAFAAASPVGGSLATRLGNRWTTTMGCGVLAAGLLTIGLGAWQESIGIVVVGFIVQGLGEGIMRPPLITSLANSVHDRDLGIASASERMMWQVGSSFGITLLTIIYADDPSPATFLAVFATGACLAALGTVSSTFLRPGSYTEEPIEEPLDLAEVEPNVL